MCEDKRMSCFSTSLDPSGERNRSSRRDFSQANNDSNQGKSAYSTRQLANEPSLSSSGVVEISISKLNDACAGDAIGRRRSTSAKKDTRQRRNAKKKQVFDMSVSSLEIDLDTEDETDLSDSRFSDGVTKFGTIDLIPTKPKSWNPKRSAGWADWTDQESQRLSQSTHHSRSRRTRERGSRTRDSKPSKSRSHKEGTITPMDEPNKPQSLKGLRWSSSSNHVKSERNRSSVKQSSSRCRAGPSSDKARLDPPQQAKRPSKDGTSSSAGTRPRHRSRSASRRKQLLDARRQDSRWGVENTSNHSQGSAAPMDRVPASPRRKNTLRVPRKGMRAPAPVLSI